MNAFISVNNWVIDADFFQVHKLLLQAQHALDVFVKTLQYYFN